MDNTKIFIDIDDEITFIAERIFAAKTTNIIVVIPERATILSSLASLKLLSYVVEKSGKHVVIVTMDDIGKTLAQRAGFKTRGRVGEVEATIWNEFSVQAQPAKVNPLLENGEQVQPVPVEEEPKQEPAANPDIVGNMIRAQEEINPSVQTPAQQPPVPVIPTPPEPVENAQPAVVETEEEKKEFVAKLQGEIEKEIESNELKETPPVEQEEMVSKSEAPSTYEVGSVAAVSESVQEAKTTPSKPKFVESVKIVKLDGFELVVGGDAAVIQKSRKLNRKDISQQTDTISSLHYEAQSQGEADITGKDVEANSVKKKRITKFQYIKMETERSIHTFKSKHLRKWMYVPLVLILIAVVLIGFVVMPSASVAVQISSRALSSASEVTANANNQSVNVSAATIPAYAIAVTESSSSSAPTTGTKTFGNPATGTVTITASAQSAITIPQGAIFTTNNSNAYTYTLNTAVSIPDSTQTPQTETGVSLTAVNNGSQYNIPFGGTQSPVSFTIVDPSKSTKVPATAVQSSAFSGGTTEQDQVVAESDQSSLLSSLENQLYQKGQNELTAEFSSDETSVKDSLKNEDITKAFDNSVGDKATILNLSLTTKTSILVYKSEDLNTYAKDLLSQHIAGKETLADISQTATLMGYNTATGNITLHVVSSAKATPLVSTSSIVQHIKGEFVGSASSYIESLNGVKSVSISVSPFWVGIIHLMPLRSSSIHITIQAS